MAIAETAGAGGLLAESVMLKRNTFVANAAFIAANPQGGNDIVGVLQGCDRVGGGTKLNIRANGIKYTSGQFRQISPDYQQSYREKRLPVKPMR